MPILFKIQVKRTAKTPLPRRRARVGDLCGFHGTAERVTHQKPENRTLSLRSGALEKVASTERTSEGSSRFAQNIQKGKIGRF